MKLILYVLILMLAGCLPPAAVPTVDSATLFIIGGVGIVLCCYIMRTQDRDDWLTTWLFWLGITSICIGGIFG